MRIAFKVFNKEVDDLLILYNSTLIGYEQTKKIKENYLDFPEEQIQGIIVDDLPDFTENVNSLAYDFRTLILIRIISILERFLIDNIKFIFSETKEPFKTKVIIEIQQQELFSYKSLNELFSKIISKECRQLSSGGFDKIIKYYKQKFNMDLSLFFPSKERIIEYHDRRHLFVHNLGRTDKQYRHKYKTEKAGLSISDIYIRNAINDIKSFADIINKNTIEFIEAVSTKSRSSSNTRTMWFSFQTKVTTDFIEDNFSFWSNDELVVLKDILVERKNLSDNFIEMKISGEKAKIKDYLSIVKTINRTSSMAKHFTILFDDYVQPVAPPKVKRVIDPTPKIEISSDSIMKVKSLLPEEPWPIGIHKIIAEELGLSNVVVYRIIQIITKSSSN